MTNRELLQTLDDNSFAAFLVCPANFDLEFDKPNECKKAEKNNIKCVRCTSDWLKREVGGSDKNG